MKFNQFDEGYNFFKSKWLFLIYMKKYISIFLLLISISSNAQKLNYGIKFSPLCLADDINFSAIQFGFESRLRNRLTMFNEFGIKCRKSSYENKDTSFIQSIGYRYRLELRYYFANRVDTGKLNSLTGFYVGANCAYSNNQFNYQLTYRHNNDSSTWKKDALGITKTIVTPNLIVGREMRILKLFYLDVYCGIGARVRTISSIHKEYNSQIDELSLPIDVTIKGSQDIVNSKDAQTVLFNFTSGVRIGCRF